MKLTARDNTWLTAFLSDAMKSEASSPHPCGWIGEGGDWQEGLGKGAGPASQEPAPGGPNGDCNLHPQCPGLAFASRGCQLPVC